MNDQWQKIRNWNRRRSATVVLVYDPYFGMKCAYKCPLRKKWMSEGAYDFEVGGKEIELRPTHWQPLPKPPVKPKKSKTDLRQ